MATIPQEFIDALKAAGLEDFFAGCTDAHQNEYLKWIGEAKKAETRQARIAKAMQMIGGKKAEEEKRANKSRVK